MRILLLCTGLKLGGAEHQVAALARQFVRTGHAVAVVSLTPGREVALPPDVTVLQLDMRKTPLSFARVLWRLHAFVTTWRPQVIHAHMVHANLVARALAALTNAPPVLCTAHSVREGGRLRMLAYRLTDRWATLTTHVSEAGKEAMIDAGAVPPGRIRIVPNGIDTNRFRPDPASRQLTRQLLGVGPNTKLVINVGRLVPEKAQQLLIEAFASIVRATDPAQQPDTHLFLVGDGPLRGDLEACIHRNGLTAFVTLLGKRTDVPDLLNAADLFVLSSDVEGMPLVIGEALASGCPVVATDAPGVAELLGNVGEMVARGNAAALSDAMTRALAKGIGSPANQATRRERVQSGFSLESVARQWVACYAGLAGMSAPAAPELAR